MHAIVRNHVQTRSHNLHHGILVALKAAGLTMSPKKFEYVSDLISSVDAMKYLGAKQYATSSTVEAIKCRQLTLSYNDW